MPSSRSYRPNYDNYDNNGATNESTLRATRDLQQQSIDALARIRMQAAETEAVGAATLTQLEEQDQRLDRTMASTQRLNDNLTKTEGLQNRFARLSLQFGNKRTATKHVREERRFREGPAASDDRKPSRSERDQPPPSAGDPPTFKRRGPRPSSKKMPATPEEVVTESSKTSKEVSTEMDKAELFAGRKTSSKGKKASSRSKKTNPSSKEDTPLTEDDRRQLEEIEAHDGAIDEGLDVLGNQLDSLYALSKSLGDTAKTQNKKLTSIHDDMDKADEKQRTVNQRAKLFMMNRREKTKENNRFNPLSVMR